MPESPSELLTRAADLVRSLPRMVLEFVEGSAVGFLRALHQPTQVGPPERVACLRCQEPWPCRAWRMTDGEDQP